MKKDNKKIIKKGLVLVISIILILLILNSFYIHLIEKNKIIFRKELEWQNYRLELQDNKLDYAFFGDSHARQDLNPEFINNSFNFGTSGEDYTETYYRILNLLKNDNIEINSFVLEIDSHSFSDKIRTNQRLFRNLHYYSDFVKLSKISEFRDESFLSVWIKSKFIVIGKGEEMISYLSSTESTQIKKGWTNSTRDFSKEKNKRKSAEARVNLLFSEEKKLLENRSLSHFLKIINLAEENNISIFLIMYPLSYEYNLELEKNNFSRKNHYEKLFYEIDKTGAKYKVLDYYNLFVNNPEYFDDSDHLNYNGAEILSKKVAENLKNENEFLEKKSKNPELLLVFQTFTHRNFCFAKAFADYPSFLTADLNKD
jgi:hypothetical protein